MVTIRRLIGTVAVATTWPVHGIAGQAQPPTERSEAVVTIRVDGSVNLFAVRQISRKDWSHVPRASFVSTSGSRTQTAFTPAPGPSQPVLLVAKSQPGPPRFSIATQTVNPGVEVTGGDVAQAVELDPSQHPCDSDSWIAAFYIEGIGPNPTHPATLVLRSNGETQRLVVEPEALVPGPPDLRLLADDLTRGRSSHGNATIQVAVASGTPNTIAIVLTRRGDRWQGFGRIVGEDGYFHNLQWDPSRDGPIEEWRVYFLTDPPRC